MLLEEFLKLDVFDVFDGIKYARFPFNDDEEGLFAIGFASEDDPTTDLVFPEEINGYKIIGILPNAFSDNKKLKTVKLCDGIIILGAHTFDNCTSLEHVLIGENVIGIGEACFKNCSNLKEIDIPNSVESIGDFAFYHCDSITSVEIKNRITEIGVCAFSHCQNLTVFIQKECVDTNRIKKGAFSRCPNLKTAFIPCGLISSYAFSFCPSLITCTIATFHEFGSCFFLGDVSLTDVTLVEALKAYKPNYFYGCSSLEMINNIDPIDERFFMDYSEVLETKDFAYRINHRDYIEILYAKNDDSAYIIPNEIDGIAVCKLNDGCFFGHENLTSLTLGENIESLENDCFFDCINLAQLDTNIHLYSIGRNCFTNCTHLEKLDFGQYLYYVNKYAFDDCIGLKEISFKSGPNALGEGTFRNCVNLKKVKLGDELVSLDLHAFDFCMNLSHLTIPKNVSIITGELNCPLKTIKVNSKNKTFDSRNDCNCIIETDTNRLLVGTQKSFIPDGIEEIEERAFKEVIGMNEIYIPSSVKYIEGNCFSLDEDLKVVIANDSPLSLADFRESECKVTFEEIKAEA